MNDAKSIMKIEFGIHELTEVNIKLMEKQILEIPEKPETKEQYDSARQFNVDAKKLFPRIEERRKELKAPVIEKGKAIDDTAKQVKAMVKPLIELSGTRRNAWEAEKASEKAKKERQEIERLASIQAKIDILNHLAGKPIEYNRTAADIEKDISHIEEFEVSAVDFHEKMPEAEMIKSVAIVAAKNALANRKKFEADQAEVARVKEEQEAEAVKLAEDRAKMEEEKKDREEKARKDAEAIQSDREKLEKEKAEAANAAIVTERESVWDIAHQENFNLDHSNAIIEHHEYKKYIMAEMDNARADAMKKWQHTEQAKAEAAERLKLIGPDKLILTTIANSLDEVICGVDIPELNTDDANALVRDLISNIKSLINDFEQKGLALK